MGTPERYNGVPDTFRHEASTFVLGGLSVNLSQTFGSGGKPLLAGHPYLCNYGGLHSGCLEQLALRTDVCCPVLTRNVTCSSSKDARTYAHMRRPILDCNFEICTHSHRE